VVDSSHDTEASEYCESTNSMRYCIFTIGEKKEILQLMKKYITEVLHLPSDKEDKENIDKSDWVQYFDLVGKENFLYFLKRHIPLYVSFILCQY